MSRSSANAEVEPVVRSFSSLSTMAWTDVYKARAFSASAISGPMNRTAILPTPAIPGSPLFADPDGTNQLGQGAPGSVVPGVVCELAGAHLFGECGDHFRAGAGAAQHDGHRRFRVRYGGTFGPVADQAHGMRGHGSAECCPQFVNAPAQPDEVFVRDLVGSEFWPYGRRRVRITG